jgi:methylated-DNA-[protein]-cysteine S-methyltransferase
MQTRPNQTYQAVVAAPGFSLGVQCNDDEITGIDFIEPRPEEAPSTPLAAEAVRQLKAYIADPAFTFGLPLRPAGTLPAPGLGPDFGHPDRPDRHLRSTGQEPQERPRAVGQACGANPLSNRRALPPRRRHRRRTGGFARERGGLLDVKRWLTHENRALGDTFAS